MKTSVEELEDNKVKLSIEVEEQEFEKAVDAAFRKIAREVNIPGFRPGKAPRRILEKRLGEGVARGEALRDAIPEYYADAVREHDVDVIAAPEIEITEGEDEGPVAFEAVLRKFRNSVRLFTYDAGVTGAENCRVVVDEGKDYLFRIKDDRWVVTQEAKRLLGCMPNEKAAAHTEDVLSKGVRPGSPARSVHRYVFIRPVAVVPGFWTDLPGLKTLVRVRSEVEENGQVVSSEDRYYISSLAADRLEGWQWLALVRNHWAVENNCHWTFDAIFQEDDHLWIEANARGAVVMTLLRRIAYNLLSYYRSVTLRSEEKRSTPWRRLMNWVYATVVGASDLQLSGLCLRERTVVADV